MLEGRDRGADVARVPFQLADVQQELGPLLDVLDVIGQTQERLRREADPEMRSLFPDAPYATLNIGSIRGGSAINMIADECTVAVSYRPTPDLEPLAIYDALSKELTGPIRDFETCDGSAIAELGPAFFAPGMQSPDGSALERTLLDAEFDIQGVVVVDSDETAGIEHAKSLELLVIVIISVVTIAVTIVVWVVGSGDHTPAVDRVFDAAHPPRPESVVALRGAPTRKESVPDPNGQICLPDGSYVPALNGVATAVR